MKILYIILLLLTTVKLLAQCEERNSAASVSLHLSAGTKTGFGGEFGSQGLLDNLSGFLGIDITSIKGNKGEDSSVSLIYTKGLFRFYQSHNEDLYFAAVLAPAFVNTDFDLLSGLRLLYVTGRNMALSVEPLWYAKEKQFHLNVNVHFLL